MPPKPVAGLPIRELEKIQFLLGHASVQTTEISSDLPPVWLAEADSRGQIC
jgi:site-specific recombinase XerD